MNEQTRKAYRHLIYVVVLRIRNDYASGLPSRNPLVWYRKYHRSRLTGEVTDWLHNLAQFSTWDFERFNEAEFWREHAELCSRFPGEGLERYRQIFDDYLAGKIAIV